MIIILVSLFSFYFLFVYFFVFCFDSLVFVLPFWFGQFFFDKHLFYLFLFLFQLCFISLGNGIGFFYNSGQCQVQITIDRDPNDGKQIQNKKIIHLKIMQQQEQQKKQSICIIERIIPVHVPFFFYFSRSYLNMNNLLAHSLTRSHSFFLSLTHSLCLSLSVSLHLKYFHLHLFPPISVSISNIISCLIIFRSQNWPEPLAILCFSSAFIFHLNSRKSYNWFFVTRFSIWTISSYQ